jgi:hypothetical protein
MAEVGKIRGWKKNEGRKKQKTILAPRRKELQGIRVALRAKKISQPRFSRLSARQRGQNFCLSWRLCALARECFPQK